MEGAAADLAAALADQMFNPAQHLLRGAARKGEEQNRTRSHTAFDQSRDAINQGAGLARACACHYQQRTVAMNHSGELLRIEHFGVADAELAFVRLRNGRPALKDDYLLGHDGPSLA
jgi:hypothetical protein